MSKFKYILFDFDGTLVDSSEGIFKSLTYAFEEMGHGTPSEELLKKFVGPPLHYSFTNFCGFSSEHAYEMTEKYRERYKVKGYLENRVYDGIPEMLEQLQNEGYILGTASSKPVKFIDDICTQRDIKKYFAHIGGTQFDNIKESKTIVIENAIKALGGNKENTLMVGDRLFDIQGAHEAGIPCCAVLFGFGDRPEFEEYKAEYIIEKPQDIFDILKEE